MSVLNLEVSFPILSTDIYNPTFKDLNNSWEYWDKEDSELRNSDDLIKALQTIEGYETLTAEERLVALEAAKQKAQVIKSLVQELQHYCKTFALSFTDGDLQGFNGIESMRHDKGFDKFYGGEWVKQEWESSNC